MKEKGAAKYLSFFKYSNGNYGVSCKEKEEKIIELEIPAEHEGAAVYAINDGGFPLFHLQKITIPESITYIGRLAFDGCSNLAELVIPEGVKTIREGAFRYCRNMIIYCERKSAPDGWDENWNFSKCPVVWDCKNNDVATDGCIYVTVDGLRYAIKDGVATVAKQPQNLTEAKIRKSITYNGKEYTVENITEYAFSCLHGMTKVYIPYTVKKIGRSAFFNCHSLEGVYITDLARWCEISFQGADETNPLYHAHRLYLDGELVTELVIPDGVTEIPACAFYGLEVAQARLSETVRSIGYYAFKCCRSLKSITIPASVEKIDIRPFEYCTSLTIYCEAKSKPDGWNESWASDWTDDTRSVVWDYKNK